MSSPPPIRLARHGRANRPTKLKAARMYELHTLDIRALHITY